MGGEAAAPTGGCIRQRACFSLSMMKSNLWPGGGTGSSRFGRGTAKQVTSRWISRLPTSFSILGKRRHPKLGFMAPGRHEDLWGSQGTSGFL